MIEVIQTEYKGYLFRSRLEARWAVFFDVLELKWEYETEGYILSTGRRYLPDFYLPEIGYIEIKGKAPSLDELMVCSSLAGDSGTRVYIFWGQPIDACFPETGGITWWSGDAFNLAPGDGPGIVFYDNESYDYPYLFCECKKCGKIGVQYVADSSRNCSCQNGRDRFSKRLMSAAIKARRARFEHGEAPLRSEG